VFFLKWESFSVIGSYKQYVFPVREVDGCMVPVLDHSTDCYHVAVYDAFDRDDLLPSLVRLVLNNKKDWKGKCKEWIRKNGFLALPRSADPQKGESLAVFWQYAQEIASLWVLYTQAVNEDIDALKAQINLEVVELTAEEMAEEVWAWCDGNDGRVEVRSPLEMSGCAFGVRLEDMKDDPVVQYRQAVFLHIAEKVSHYAGNLFFATGNNRFIDGVFKTELYINPECLLPALYLQWLQLLAVKRRVCPTCLKSFVPGRDNKKFCRPACRSTFSTRKRDAEGKRSKKDGCAK
jgi:hypothetical protein